MAATSLLATATTEICTCWVNVSCNAGMSFGFIQRGARSVGNVIAFSSLTRMSLKERKILRYAWAWSSISC